MLLISFKKEGPFLENLNNKIKIINLNTLKKILVTYRLLKILKKYPDSTIISTARGSNILLGFVTYFLEKKSYNLVFREANTFYPENQIILFKRIFRYLFLQIGYFTANLIIANSNDVKNQLKKQLIFPKKIVKINNPALRNNLRELRNVPIKHEWFLNKKFKVLITIGR